MPRRCRDPERMLCEKYLYSNVVREGKEEEEGVWKRRKKVNNMKRDGTGAKPPPYAVSP